MSGVPDNEQERAATRAAGQVPARGPGRVTAGRYVTW